MWARLHGAMRAVDPPATTAANEDRKFPGGIPPPTPSVDPGADSVVVRGVEVQKGTCVRLAPSHRADAQDLFLRDLTATVAGVFLDVDGARHVAVTLDDDPAGSRTGLAGPVPVLPPRRGEFRSWAGIPR